MPTDLFLYKQQQPAATVTKAANQAVIHIHSIPAMPTETTGKITEDLITILIAWLRNKAATERTTTWLTSHQSTGLHMNCNSTKWYRSPCPYRGGIYTGVGIAPLILNLITRGR